VGMNMTKNIFIKLGVKVSMCEVATDMAMHSSVMMAISMQMMNSFCRGFILILGASVSSLKNMVTPPKKVSAREDAGRIEYGRIRPAGYGVLLLKDVGLRDVHEAQGLALFLVIHAHFVASIPGAVGHGEVFFRQLNDRQSLLTS